MKYLKKFELIDNDIILKKYVAWKFPTNIMILETIDAGVDFSKFVRLYDYHEGGYRITISDEQEYTFNKHEIKKRVIYTTDNKSEILDVDLLETFFSLEKYNI
jgi:hypothetical protein